VRLDRRGEKNVGQPPAKIEHFELPDDLQEQISALSLSTNESPRFIIIAAIEHLFRIPEEQRRAVLRGASLRRKG
jgi:hypothetical protein